MRLKSYSLPALAALALALACSDAVAAFPDQVSSLVEAPGGRALYLDDDGKLNCKAGYTLKYAPTGSYGERWDLDGNDYFCGLRQPSRYAWPPFPAIEAADDF